jgi:hypothetical protein
MLIEIAGSPARKFLHRWITFLRRVHRQIFVSRSEARVARRVIALTAIDHDVLRISGALVLQTDDVSIAAFGS